MSRETESLTSSGIRNAASGTSEGSLSSAPPISWSSRACETKRSSSSSKAANWRACPPSDVRSDESVDVAPLNAHVSAHTESIRRDGTRSEREGRRVPRSLRGRSERRDTTVSDQACLTTQRQSDAGFSTMATLVLRHRNAGPRPQVVGRCLRWATLRPSPHRSAERASWRRSSSWGLSFFWVRAAASTLVDRAPAVAVAEDAGSLPESRLRPAHRSHRAALRGSLWAGRSSSIPASPVLPAPAARAATTRRAPSRGPWLHGGHRAGEPRGPPRGATPRLSSTRSTCRRSISRSRTTTTLRHLRSADSVGGDAASSWSRNCAVTAARPERDEQRQRSGDHDQTAERPVCGGALRRVRPTRPPPRMPCTRSARRSRLS